MKKKMTVLYEFRDLFFAISITDNLRKKPMIGRRRAH